MKTETKMTGLDGVLELLQKLPPEIASKRGGPVRVAVRKAAQVMLLQARANFTAAVSLPGKTGVTNSTGFTAKQIVMKRKLPRNGVRGERFIVSVNYAKHPNGKALEKSRPYRRKRTSKMTVTKLLRANDVAFMMEYGTSKQPATPWLRPAFESRKEEALLVMQTEVRKAVDRAVKKLAKRNARR